MKLQGGPFITISFILKKNKDNVEKMLNNLYLLNSHGIYFNINNNRDVFFSSGIEYINGVVLNDKKFFDLYLVTISNELILFEINFIYHTGINGEVYGVSDDYINERLKELLVTLKKNFNFEIGIIGKEASITEFFITKECYPNNEYNISNFNFDRLKSDTSLYCKIISNE